MGILNYPSELASLRQWVCWRLEHDVKHNRDAKVPYSPVSGRKASASDAKSWGTLEEAMAAKERYLFSGVGFMFTVESGIVGIDIDSCLENGTPNDVAADILTHLPPTYIEISPSGTGLHIFLKGKVPAGGNRSSKTGVEMYAQSRYFTMTGITHEKSVDSIAGDNGAVDYIHRKYVANQRKTKTQSSSNQTMVSLPDDDLLKLAQSSKDGEAFSSLWRGEWQGKYKSQSEADYALCGKLAFWSARNEQQVDRLFRKSGLFREKWDIRHSAGGITYGEQTVKNACAAANRVYTPPKQQKESEIFGRNGVYYRRKDDKYYQITNFTVEPIEMIEAEDEAQITCDFVTDHGERFRQTLTSADFSTVPKFKAVLNKKTIAMSFTGGEGDLELFKVHIYNDLEWVKKRGVKALGIYQHSRRLVFVDTKGAVGVKGKAVNDMVQLEKYKSLESNILQSPMLDKASFLALAQNILSYNKPSRTVPFLSWCAACFIKPHLRKAGVKFPHLFLIGEPGSGKSSSMERVLLPVFGKNKITAASQLTSFTLMKDSNSSNIIPQTLDEFKPSKLDKLRLHALYNHFRDAYDWHDGVRGRADQTQIVYDLLAPIAVAGEESADEAAIRERSVELLFSKKDLRDDGHLTAFTWMSANEGLVGSLGRSLLDTALQTTPTQARSWFDEGDGCFAKELPTRIRSNLCVLYAGLSLVGGLCQSLGISFDTAFPVSHEACAANMEYAAREYLLDDSGYNKGAVEQAFEVMARMRLKPGEDFAFENNGQFLCLCMAPVYDRYTRYRKDYAVLGEVLPYGQFKKQLEHSEFFVEKNRVKQFKEGSRRVWVVDYHKLGKRCDVSGFITEAGNDAI